MQNNHNHELLGQYNRYALFSAFFSVCASILLIAMKAYAYHHSDSAGVLASLIDSSIDLVLSVFGFFALRYALKPADEEHRHGHGNMEAIIALFQSALIFGGALLLINESVSRLQNPQSLTLNWIIYATIIVSILIPMIVVAVQNHCLKKAESLAIKADRSHYQSDMIINGGILVSFLIVDLKGTVILDTLLACAIGIYMLYLSWKLCRQALDMLLDRELPEEKRDQIIKTIQSQHDIWGYHDLRTKQSGPHIFISLDIEVDPSLSLKEAHDIAKRLEESLISLIPFAEVIIHVDPADDIEDKRHKNLVNL